MSRNRNQILMYPLDGYSTFMGSIDKSDTSDSDFVRFTPFVKNGVLGDVADAKNIGNAISKLISGLSSGANTSMNDINVWAKPLHSENITQLDIFLPLKSQFLEIDNQHEWGMEDELMGEALKKGASALQNFGKGDFVGGLKNVGGAIKESVMAKVLTDLKAPLAQLGISVYDPQIQSYKDSKPIGFAMTWTMTPTSKKEAIEIKKICSAFNFLSLPQQAGNEANVSVYMRRLPCIWKIDFFPGIKKTNGMYNFIKKDNSFNCVCTSVKIKYGESAFWTSYDDGFPNQITLSLGFQEYTGVYNAQKRTGYSNIDDIMDMTF